jgi:hypothetical protein
MLASLKQLQDLLRVLAFVLLAGGSKDLEIDLVLAHQAGSSC